ncbi:DUF2058 domain-containing protein [Stenotrophomonas pavanii]|uniref:DUF2058 domain-containing protein n=1 Tax=Stenotrophomonas pavanii TaxID=487698 RepID=UPI00070E21AF|nr:DUF2058 domain-containing protein [Stenotrophomonas pavanii]KRG82868.1 nucleoprotein/polynucleotide-associated enzyme [Stenotrophomonas pavanii]MDT3530186.1 DUF2058 domain-containing protein [Stenotrophomonas pavanii]PNY73560.1 DUF2058 domain-containing protein [Stenotrophomonas pavanii]SDJ86498.1 hypothetical protein SAMN04487784_0421 [Stenotrophomonas pavanii]
MAKPNALQEQLLKAGLAKKSQASAAAREQAKARQGKAESTSAEVQREAERARAEKVERDRALAAERNAQARQAEQKAQARQIITAHAVPYKGDDEYRFSDGAAIRTLLIDPKLRKALSVGVLVIVAHGDGYALLPRAAAEKVRERTPEAIIVDHGQPGSTAEISTGNAEDDAYYAQFQVPDDLVW